MANDLRSSTAPPTLDALLWDFLQTVTKVGNERYLLERCEQQADALLAVQDYQAFAAMVAKTDAHRRDLRRFQEELEDVCRQYGLFIQEAPRNPEHLQALQDHFQRMLSGHWPSGKKRGA